MFEANFNLCRRETLEAEFSISPRETVETTFEINPSIKIHNQLTGREVEDCHPIKAITGLFDELDNKVDKVLTANRVYGTDIEGEQTTYDANSFGQVDDVQVGGVSVVQNKVASLGTMASESASDYRTASDQDTIDSRLSDRIVDIENIIDTYGDIVTHNVSEFATSAQGTLADSALQPSDIVNSTSSIATDKPLSANMGKSLQDQVDNLKARGRFLALWNCATGLAESNPPSGTYTYQAGDYFIVGVVASSGGTNYKPEGSSYTTGVASTVVETQAVDTDDVYYYDGHVWRLQVNTQKEIGFVNIAGSPYDNTNLASALNDKQDEISDLTAIRSGAASGATAVQPSALSGYVPTSRKINGKALSANISLTSDDIEYTSLGESLTYGVDLLLNAIDSMGESVGGEFDADGEFAKASYKVDEDTPLNNITDHYTLVTAIGMNDCCIGNVSTLTTTAKTDCVSAINEINGLIGDIEPIINAIRGV